MGAQPGACPELGAEDALAEPATVVLERVMAHVVRGGQDHADHPVDVFILTSTPCFRSAASLTCGSQLQGEQSHAGHQSTCFGMSML